MYRFLIIVSLFCSLSSYAQQARKPNILIILADDLGWGDLGFHGSDILTPNLDRFAKQSTLLDQFYTAPICSPTRAGLLTGRYPNRFGLRQNVIPPWSNFGVDTSEVFLPTLLARAGYINRAVIGKWHLGASAKMYLPLHRGFTHFYGFYNGAIDYFTHMREGELDWHNDSAVSHDKGYTTDLITREAVKKIDEYATQGPFFMYVAYNAPHGPLQANEHDLALYGFDKNKPLFQMKGDYGMRGRGNTKKQTYGAMVTGMDRGIGEILQKLKTLKIEDNTLVLFLSDNGAVKNNGGSSGGLRGGKFQEWSGGVRSPAIIHIPGRQKAAGTTISQVMGYIDVMPTIVAIAGIRQDPKNKLDGINMLPVLNGQVAQIDRYFYLGHGAIIHDPWKLIRAHSGNASMHLKKDLLFNIRTDSSEQNDLTASHPRIYEALKKILKPFDAIKAPHPVPPYGQGRKGFVAPNDWEIKK